MARDIKNDRFGGKGMKSSEILDDQPEVKKNSAFVNTFAQVTEAVNSSVNPIKDTIMNPAAPFQAVDHLVSKIPFVGPLITNMPGPEEVMEGGSTLIFQTLENAFTKAADYVGNHGKKVPDQTQLASAEPADGHGLSGATKPKGKNRKI
jgi:3-polyprenyl-4-hydroxybenzoate decarboxylase